MTDYPFNLRGPKGTYRGRGRSDGEAQKSPEFPLRSGLLIAEIQHHGSGECKLSFVATESMAPKRAMATGAARGTAAGSVVPVVGKPLGKAFGSAAGAVRQYSPRSFDLAKPTMADLVPVVGTARDVARLAGAALGGKMHETWTPVEYSGAFLTHACVLVNGNEQKLDCLAPGQYRLEVKSKSPWSCNFIQPELGQAQSDFCDDKHGEDNQDGKSKEAGEYILGPFKPVQRPLTGCFQHRGAGWFSAAAFSVDGIHSCTLYHREGQFYAADHMTDIEPGKEYFLYVNADSEWDITFTEGY